MSSNGVYQRQIKHADEDSSPKEALNGRHPVPVVLSINGVVLAPPNGEQDDDPWALPELHEQGIKWSDLTLGGKLIRLVVAVIKICALLFLLYMFICSLDFLSSAFRLLGGKQAGKVFRDSKLLRNPVVGLMIGVLATVLVQSSSTSTSIVVTMVGTGLISVSHAVPIVMGANIGTSVTNTIVSLSQAPDRNEFRRAFAAATIHDMFNWLAVIVLLPIEVATGFLEKLTEVMMDSVDWTPGNNLNRQMLQALTKPFTSFIIQLDKKLIEDLAAGKRNETGQSFLKKCFDVRRNTTQDCGYLMEKLGWSDSTVGILMLILSLILLCSCLVIMVKLLHSMLRGHIAIVIKKIINTEPQFPYNHLVGYFAMLIGCGLTIVVQSSSIFTSALTPLAGIGVISLERMYPLTLGSNIGTTTTSILAALAAPADRLRYSLQIAFCHLFFNICGILLFYPIPITRLPIKLAKLLGSTTAKYRWFSIFYLLVMFLLIPGFVFILSMAGPVVFAAVGVPLLILLFFIIAINVIQKKRPSLLPLKLQSWNFMPLWMHSLDPIDQFLAHAFGALRCCKSCLQPPLGHDAPALGIIPNQSQMNILEKAAEVPEYHTMNGLDNTGFNWTPKKMDAGSTMV